MTTPAQLAETAEFVRPKWVRDLRDELRAKASEAIKAIDDACPHLFRLSTNTCDKCGERLCDYAPSAVAVDSDGREYTLDSSNKWVANAPLD